MKFGTKKKQEKFVQAYKDIIKNNVKMCTDIHRYQISNYL